MSRIATAWARLRVAIGEFRVQLRLCLRVTVAALLSFILTQLLHLPLALWAVLTAVIVTQMSVGRSLNATVDYLIGTLGGAIYGGAVGALVPHTSEIGVLGALAIAVAPLALLAATRPNFRVAPFTAILVLLAPAITQSGSIEAAFFRVLEVALGCVTALVVSFLIVPERAQGLAIDAAAQLLDLMARVLPELFMGFTRTIEVAEITRLQDTIGQAFAQLETIGVEATRERFAYLAAEPDLGPLLRTLLRLRHDLVMIGRAVPLPLPVPFDARLGPPLARVGATAEAYLRDSAAALLARRASPPRNTAQAALDGYSAELAAVRREGLTRGLSEEAVEHIFALGFALEQLHRNFGDLERCVTDCARRNVAIGGSGAGATTSGAGPEPPTA